jgi:peptidoglycan/LPS O-acetylase OafA/YrhL
MRLPLWPAALLRLPRRTVRLRLTLLYGALFLVSGVVLLAVTYFLQQVPRRARLPYHLRR